MFILIVFVAAVYDRRFCFLNSRRSLTATLSAPNPAVIDRRYNGVTTP
jgi:hypothetical protein